MNNLLLTKEERDRFIMWLDNEVNTSKGIIEQMKKINVPGSILLRFELELQASIVISNKLKSINEETI